MNCGCAVLASLSTTFVDHPEHQMLCDSTFYAQSEHGNNVCFWYDSSKQTAVIRASDDFWPKDPASHTIHIASVAYNTLFLAEFMQPDWDMFHVIFLSKVHSLFLDAFRCYVAAYQKCNYIELYLERSL